MKNLIIYYSRKGNNYWNGSVKNLSKGNTEIVAEYIKDAVGGDLFEIETVVPYSEDYFVCTEQAKKELQDGTRPNIKKYPNSIAEYDYIFVGYPNWWGTMPMAMFTLLEKYDFSNKIIIPFCTNEGSGLGNSERNLKKICKNAIIAPGLSVRGTQVINSKEKIYSWAKKSIEK